ncbi:phytanoyl-CoA dioxygenase family protein [Pseudoblastomonas flavescens]|uniref:phytanoyl-CoA dioxygenase family protein n=1 Tax=Alteriqipengyuania flavescens TaxID=3053610 RepID=UPI00299F8C45|nr:phytanoyl-CoA dioxygenase family protein [Alteriqipengyuania flavescens]
MTASLDFERHGAMLCRGLALPILPDCDVAFRSIEPPRAGTRLYDRILPISVIGAASPITQVVRQRLGPKARPVRAVFFDKRATSNWALGWHQDRTICVADRHEVPGYGPWSRKLGQWHVEPPFAILERMVTVRIHLDCVDRENAPLKIALASHLRGKVAAVNAADVAADCAVMECLADRGDMWVYATPILHASDASRSDAGRRVLQIDWSADDLAEGLQWRGLGPGAP